MKRKIAIATITATALIGAGGVVAAADGEAQQATKTSSVQDDDTRDAKQAKTTAAEAAAAAQKSAPGTVTGIELDDEKNNVVWEVELTKGNTSHEVTLDAATNKVISDHKEQDDDEASPTQLSAAEAARAAAAHGTVTSVDLEDDAKKPAWEVETLKNGKEHELTVDTKTGKVTQERNDESEDTDDD
ncbi:MAG: PepSY domain-containing protein [Streptomyces sp.]|uniref:PepSY domain-containing protein n=1 Tax=Streptomyces sp. TaxID=1931 RepID=UPI003D6C5EC8